MNAQYVVTVGLLCDIAGAFLVANEVVRVFRESMIIDVGGSGTINGGFEGAVNPRFEEHEKRKRRYMSWGLLFLVLGFLLQIIGTWLPSL